MKYLPCFALIGLLCTGCADEEPAQSGGGGLSWGALANMQTEATPQPEQQHPQKDADAHVERERRPDRRPALNPGPLERPERKPDVAVFPRKRFERPGPAAGGRDDAQIVDRQPEQQPVVQPKQIVAVPQPKRKLKQAAGLDWHTELPAALEEARKAGKPVLCYRVLGDMTGFM